MDSGESFIKLPPDDKACYFVPLKSDCSNIVTAHMNIFNRKLNSGYYWILLQDSVSEIMNVLQLIP
jgi:hypothetical protein